jgi:putative ABC transport system permease protein
MPAIILYVYLLMNILIFGLAATGFSTVLFGCAPAWQASMLDPNSALKESGSSGAGIPQYRLRQFLVVGQFAVSLTLLAAAGMALYSFWNIVHVDLGVRADHVLTFTLAVPEGTLTDGKKIVSFYRELLTRLEALPGTSRATVATGRPLEYTGFDRPFTVVGQPGTDPSLRPTVGFQMVTPGYFQTFRIKVLRGRAFTDEDVMGTLPVCMVNESFLRRYLPGMDPLTQRVELSEVIPGVARPGPPMQWQIVGVFHDVPTGGVRKNGFAEIDFPFWQSPWPETELALRTFGEPSEMIRSVVAAVATLNSTTPVTNIRTMVQIVDESRAGDRFETTLYTIFASVGLLLATSGIYGLMSFAVAQRHHDIAIRIAVGASRRRILSMILQQGIALVLIGSTFGIIGAIFVGRTMRSLLYGVRSVDVPAFAGVILMLVGSAVLGCYIPRAARIDPMTTLRYE